MANPPLETGVRHAGCNHYALPGTLCRWCGRIVEPPAPAPAPRPRKQPNRKRAA